MPSFFLSLSFTHDTLPFCGELSFHYKKTLDFSPIGLTPKFYYDVLSCYNLVTYYFNDKCLMCTDFHPQTHKWKASRSTHRAETFLFLH